MRCLPVALFVLLVGQSLAAAIDPARLPPPAPRKVDFVRDIQPLFLKHCVDCHGERKQRSGLRLDDADAALRGGEMGKAIIPGDSAGSPLIHFVSGLDEEVVMPPEGPRLDAAQVGLLRAWIDQGALWPAAPPAVLVPPAAHWAFKAAQRPKPPAAGHPVDAFIVAKLAEKNLTLCAPADRRTLIRRLYFDLIGLPPTPEEADAFVADADPAAYEMLVDRLLASPRYGERWARHWLDVVRFAESNGFETNGERKNAWPYRDWVIAALNDDKPYDRFIMEQLAGDTLGAHAATGFLVGGATDVVKSPDPVLTANQRADELHDMVSTTGSAFLGITTGCARCHDHKFDPVLTTDYYALVACFAGVQHGERAIQPAQGAEVQARTERLRARLAPVELSLAQFEPLARAARTRILRVDDPKHTSALLPSKGAPAVYPAGTGRGEAGDTGNATRLPTLGTGYLYWNEVAGKDVFAWSPRVQGRFRIWLSWGAGFATHAQDARYLLDRDGDTTTTQDQTEMVRVNQQKLADGSGSVPGTRQWSGFLDAGAYDLLPASRLVLRGGATTQYVTADMVVLQEATPRAPSSLSPRLPVTRGRNVDRFAPIEAKFLRFIISETSQLEPCIDELEVFSAGPSPRNVAATAAGANATSSGDYPGNPFHKLAHLNDGLYGNERSWISNERGKGWVRIEFAKVELIDRVVWSRDREMVPRYNDRLATHYRIEFSRDGIEWNAVATSEDRLPFGTKIPGGAIYSIEAAPRELAGQLSNLLAERTALKLELEALTALPQVYAGRMVTPGETYRMNRGDPMQPREVIAPGVIAKMGAPFTWTAGAPEPARRLALAKWIASADHPLTARVIVNRLWQHHFGAGIVDTPSDLGRNGGRPTHPELLDWLAIEFVARGWSQKAMHRLLVTSATYRQGSSAHAAGLTADRDARWLWRYPPRRVEAEVLRDTMLSASGKLDLRMGGPGFDLFEPNGNYVKVYQPRREFGPETFRRMVYQSKPRTELDDTFGVFDCPDAGQVSPRRTASITPLQALSLLNSPFALQQAEFFAARLQREADDDLPAQVRRAFLIAFTREPTADERAAAFQLATHHGLPALCRALFNAGEFLTVR